MSCGRLALEKAGVNVLEYYASGVKDNKRLKMLGNGWTMDIIAHIFSYLKENEMELEKQNLNEPEKKIF